MNLDNLFRALGNKHRRNVLRLTGPEEWCVSDLAVESGVAQPGMTRHLQKLGAVGLVDLRASLSEDGGKVTAVRTNVAELERRLAEAVRECHPYGLEAITFLAGEGEETRTWK